jgi:hypothetical protein
MLNPTEIKSSIESADPDPAPVIQFPPTSRRGLYAVLTPRGDAMVAVARLEHMLKALDAADRAYVVDELVYVVRELGHE